MSFLKAVYQYGLWGAPLFFVGSVVSLALFIRGIVRLADKSCLASLPLQERQVVQFHEAGRVVLWVEGPRLSRRFAQLAFELASSDGSPVTDRPDLLRVISSGWSTVRMERRSFLIPAPGQYTLLTRHLGGNQDGDVRHKIVFTKPYLLQTIGHILGIIASAGLIIGSLVFFVLRPLSTGGNPTT